MMCWASLKSDGDFIGCVILNRPTPEAAADAAYDIAAAASCGKHKFDILVLEIPPGSPPIPPNIVNRLLTYDEAQAAFGDMKPLPEKLIDKLLARQARNRLKKQKRK